MPTRRTLLASLGTAAVTVTAGCSGDGGATTTTDNTGLTLSSSAFDDGGTIPRQYTCDGEDVSPPLSITGVPESASSLALRVDDPDAPTDRPFVHWLLWNLPPSTSELPSGVETTGTVDSLGGARQGTTGFGSVGYGGPCPPEGDGPHTYRWTLVAVETTLDLEPDADRDALLSALDGQRVAETTLTGTYER